MLAIFCKGGEFLKLSGFSSFFLMRPGKNNRRGRYFGMPPFSKNA